MNDAAAENSPEMRVSVQLRWGDFDSLGHVSASKYHELLVQARSSLIRARLPEDTGSFVLVRVEMNHLGEVPASVERVEIGLRVIAVGNSSFTIGQEIRTPDGRVAAEGISVLVAWDPAKRGKRPIGEAERQGLLGLSPTR